MLNPSSLVPNSQDKTVLFNTAWMQQLVPYLVGKSHPLWKKVYNIQKCIRTVDIDEVWDYSHLTMFEMMWNWSLWDYFKKEAIEWSYIFVTKYLKLDPNKLAVTVFEWDSDAPRDNVSYEYWKNIWMPEHKISFLWKKDNWWWPAWESWPCWPDTEIFYRVWKQEFPPVESNKKNDDENWMEIWNNVFMEFYKNDKWEFSKLSQQNVDTWMWFERINMLMQWVNSIYETDLFIELIKIINKFTWIQYPWFSKKDKNFSDQEKNIAKHFRIICDHLRAWAFMIWDWVIPSNEWRWYVLRRLIRRMYYNLILLKDNIDFQKFIDETINFIEKKYWNYRNEIILNKKNIIIWLLNEINAFQKTISKWIKMLEEKIQSWIKKLNWKDIFILYDTYWFPVDLTKEIADSKNIEIDLNWFNYELEQAKEKSRIWSKEMFKKWVDWSKYLNKIEITDFLWYDSLQENNSKLLKEIDIELEDWSSKIIKVLIFDKTPFYAESWWQTSDTWTIILDDWRKFEVYDVQKYAWVFLHFVR